MATILEFRLKSGVTRKARAGGEPCEVVFFTGVRYERRGQAEPRRSDHLPRDRTPDLQAKLPG